MDRAMYREDWDRNFSTIWSELQRTLRLSGAATAVLLDLSGNAVTYAGDDPEFDLSSFASLAIGGFLATREMGLLLGEDSTQWVVHQGKSGGLVLAPLHPVLILAVLFDGRTTLGLVRHQIKSDRGRLEAATVPLVRLLDEQLRHEDAEEITPEEIAAGESAVEEIGAEETAAEIAAGIPAMAAIGREPGRGESGPAADADWLDRGLERLFGSSS